MRTPMERRKAWVSASVLLISREKISLPAMAVNGVSGPRACAMPEEEGRQFGKVVQAPGPQPALLLLQTGGAGERGWVLWSRQGDLEKASDGGPCWEALGWNLMLPRP